MTPANRMDDESHRPSLRLVAGGVTPERREEEALVAAFLVGDDEAFGDLVRRHEELVLRIVRRWARDPDDARDLAQRTFVRAFEAARRAFQRPFGDRAPFQRWLVRIAVNLARNHARDATRWARAALQDAEGLAHRAPGPDADLLRRERAARLRLALRLDAELPFAEIAEALEITENAAKVSFHHAAKRLRDLVKNGEE